MLFGILIWIIISCIPLQTRPEFVVREIEACCHHRITLTCGAAAGVSYQQQQTSERDMRIMVVQARYVIDQQEEIPAVPSSQPLFPFPSPTEQQFQQEKSQDSNNDIVQSSAESDNLPTSKMKHSKAISLWDLDIKWMHDLQNDNLPYPVHVNAPPWHPSHISTYQGKAPFLLPYPRKVTLPPVIPKDGLNFSSSRVIEMPPYHIDFLDKNTIWREPLFFVGPTESSILSASPTAPSSTSSSYSAVTRKNLAATSSASSRESRSDDSFNSYYNLNHLNDVGECWSYQALSSTSATFTTDPNRLKPPWHFKDLRAYFNQRCSGRSKCTVELLRGKQPDPDVSKLCHLLPEGKITVKYLCYNASSDYVHSRCNVDVTPAKEGFLHNPGYPDLYPGDQPCQWRLHVPQQKILLVFFDISLRGQEKLVCRDQLVASEEHSQLLSTCGDHSSAVAILSESHRLNVTLIPQSRLAFPKRGFLIYYRVLGCRDPVRPTNSYMAFRNATHAYLICDLGHLYPDTLARDRWLFCNPLEDTWAGYMSHCQDVRGYSNAKNGNLSIAQVLLKNPSFWPVRNTRYQFNKDDVISDFILPICVMIALFSVNGIVLYFIWRQRQRLEEMENERNQEMEEICAAVVDDSNTPVDESTFSFPSSAVEDLWHDDHNFDTEIDETDQDRTLTTLTLHTSSPPDSAMATMRHYLSSNTGDSSHLAYNNQSNNGGYCRMSREGSSSGIFSSSNGHTHNTTFSSFQFQQHQHQQPRFGGNHHQSGISSSYVLSNGNGTLNPHNGPSNGQYQAGNGLVMGNGNGSFVGTTFYTGYSRTTAV